MFAIEAVALFDHFHFRKAMQQVTVKEPPLTLWYPGKPNAPDPWWKAYYDPKRIQMRDRYLFAALPLPAGLAATKNVDWSAIDAAAPAPKKTVKQAPSGGTNKTPAKQTPPNKAPAKKASAKKAAPSGPAPKKSAPKKSAAKKAAAKKAVAKKTRKSPVSKKTRKTAAKKKATKAKKMTARKSAATSKTKKRKNRR
jgi:hypothetical protein